MTFLEGLVLIVWGPAALALVLTLFAIYNARESATRAIRRTYFF